MIQIRLKEMEKDKEITRLKKRKEIDNNEEVLNQIQLIYIVIKKISYLLHN